MRALFLCSLAIVMAAPLLLTGCSSSPLSVPLAESYPRSTQQRLQAVEHWALLARHEAEQILLNEHLRVVPLYIKPVEAGAGGEFFRTYRQLLLSALAARGARLSTVPQGAAEVQINVDAVHHRERQFVRPASEAPALLQNLVLGDADDEVVITTQVIESERIVYSSSNRYYINATDRRQYLIPETTGQPLMPVFPATNRWY